MTVGLLLGAAVTSLAAGLAVDPIGAYHFQRIATYSVLGNIRASRLSFAHATRSARAKALNTASIL